MEKRVLHLGTVEDSGGTGNMEDDATLVTREQYVEMLIDTSFKDAAEIESGFMDWCEQHVPVWLEQGYDETWVRQRIEMAQITRGLHRKLKEQGLTMLEIRDELRKAYADHSELYDLAVEREHLHPGLLRYRGNTSDLRQRYTLRVMVYETDKLAYEKFCCWSGQPVPSTDSVFFEQPDSVRVVRNPIMLKNTRHSERIEEFFRICTSFQPSSASRYRSK
jgi:hypothetical protein